MKRSALGLSGNEFKENKEIKIAVCISGQVRGFREAASALIKLLDESGFKYEIFVHVWKNIGAKIPTSHGHCFRCFDGAFLDAWSDGIRELPFANKRLFELYPNLMNSFLHDNEVTFQELQSVYKTNNIVLEDENSEELLDLKDNQLKMFYKIEKCFELAVADPDITHILRIRPDKKLRAEVHLKDAIEFFEQNQNTVLTDGGANYFSWGHMQEREIR